MPSSLAPFKNQHCFFAHWRIVCGSRIGAITRELLYGERTSRKRRVCTSMVGARWTCPTHTNVSNKRSQHTNEHTTNAVCSHHTTHVVVVRYRANRTPNTNVSWETELDRLHTYTDTSVTSNNTTKSHRTTTRHLRAPILACHHACVSPLATFPASLMTTINMHHELKRNRCKCI